MTTKYEIPDSLLSAAMEVEDMIERGELDRLELEAFAAGWRKENGYD